MLKKHPYYSGSLVWGHVVSVSYKAVIEIDEVLYGKQDLVGRRFDVQTSDSKSYGIGVVSPLLKMDEHAAWTVYFGRGLGERGSDGHIHYAPGGVVIYDPYGFALNGQWPLRESDKGAYRKAEAMAKVLNYLNGQKNWGDFNTNFPPLIEAEKDPFLADWEKRLWRSFQPRS